MMLTKVEWAVIAAAAAIVIVFVATIPAQRRERDRFMADCAKAEPRYRCEVMWKQMHPDPLVVVAPLNR